MPRTPGATNIVSFEQRNAIQTSASKNILHLANIEGSPLVKFQALIRHQENFLDWVVERHEALVKAGAFLNQ